jgi:hypothetical protein
MGAVGSTWAVSDVHGHLADFRAVLSQAGLVDGDRWVGGGDGESHLWILGDLVDRGPDGIGVVRLVRQLQQQAPAHVHMLLGNHEALMLGEKLFPGTRFDYGAWIFWRFLSEWTGPGASEDPTVVRDVWTRAAGVSAVSALNSVLAARGTSFATAFRTFGVWERNPRLHFSEGGAYHPVRTAKSFALGPVHRRTGAWVAQLDHMSRDVVRFTPGSRLRGTWRLRVQLDMAKTSRGSAAQVLVHHRDGSVDVHVVRLSSAGDAVRHYKFSRSHVSSIDLDLVNASTSSGDDYRPEVFSARVER